MPASSVDGGAWLFPSAQGPLVAILSTPQAADNHAALHDLGGYAHETEDCWALLPDDAWATFDFAGEWLGVEVWSGRAGQPVLRRKLRLTREQFKRLAGGVLLFTHPEPIALHDFWALLERGECEPPLSVSIREKGDPQ